MKSLILLSILSACFVACQPSKAPEQKQAASAIAIDTTMVDTSAVSGVLLEPVPPPPPPPTQKYICEFVAPTLDVNDMPKEELMDITTEGTQGQFADVAMEVDDRSYNPIVSYENAEQKPEFNPKGGLETYIKDNLIYPEEALDEGISGTCVVAFTIDLMGHTTDVRILKSSGSTILDAEAIRVIRKMPYWIPGKVNGRNISVMHKLPVVFELDK